MAFTHRRDAKPWRASGHARVRHRSSIRPGTARALRRLPRREASACSCKRRGFCPSSGARRMMDTALLADDVLPAKSIRQWVLTLPFALRFLLATDPDALRQVLGIVYRTISGHILKKGRLTRSARRAPGRTHRPRGGRRDGRSSGTLDHVPSCGRPTRGAEGVFVTDRAAREQERKGVAQYAGFRLTFQFRRQRCSTGSCPSAAVSSSSRNRPRP